MPEPTADLIWLTGLAAEIEERLVGRKLRLWRRSGRYECWLDAGPGFSWIAELAPGSGRLRKAREGEVPQSDAEPPWRQWGGRRADGAEVVGVGVAGADRVLAISLHWKTRLGDDTRSELLIELGGRHTNAVLVAADGQIVDVIRPVGAGANRQRQILPGRTYVAPPSLGRVRFDEPWPWTECDDRSTLRHMSGSILAMSKPWARELCHGCDVDPDT